MQFLLTAIVAVILLVGVESSCPSVCNCTSNNIIDGFILKGDHVNCSSKGLDSIPTDLPNNTNYLWLQNNNISVIEDNAFNNISMLFTLDLHHNDISVIEETTFNHLPYLIGLNLSENSISVIEDTTFNHLPSLRLLWLNNNEISVIKDNTFNNLVNLQNLWLNNRSLKLGR